MDIDKEINAILDEKFTPIIPATSTKKEKEKKKQAVEDSEKQVAIGTAVKNARDLFAKGLVMPIKSNKDLLTRISEYFEECEYFCQLPTIEKMFLGLGLTRQTVEGWYAGNVGTDRWVNKETIEILERGKQVIAAVDSELVQLGKTKEISYVYRSKNFYGMQDKVTTEIQPVITTEYTPEQLAERAKLLTGDTK